jgi:hypothetical protein
MGRGWYGLYLGDRVIYDCVGTLIEGTVVKLFLSDKNAAIIRDDNNTDHKVVCEYCTKISPSKGIFDFRPLQQENYTVLIFYKNDFHEIFSFIGYELEEKITRLISNVGEEILKIEIYLRENALHQNTLYQEITPSETHNSNSGEI